jgi:uncharacterized protein YjdB
MKYLRPSLFSLVTLVSSLTSFGQAGTGWTLVPWAGPGELPREGCRDVHLQKGTDKDFQPWQNESAIYYFNDITAPANVQGTYQYIASSQTEIFKHYGSPSRSVNRSEIRIKDDYNSGQTRQLEGYVTFNEKLSSDQAFLQIWGHSDAGATMLQLRGKGGKITGSGRITRNLNPDFPNINYANRELKLNVIHRQETRDGNTIQSNGRIEVYIDGILFLWINDNKISNDPEYTTGANYFKYGCYGTVESSLGDAQVVWKEARYFRGGGFPGTTAQALSFPTLPAIALNGGDVTPGATSRRTSNNTATGLTVSYRSDNPAVARIVDGKIRPVSIGTAKIWAYQDGNATFAPAPVLVQTISVVAGGSVKQSQTITFPAIPDKVVGGAPFTVNATASSGLPVSYESNNDAVATVSGNTVTIKAAGSANITASQAGSSTYEAAVPVTRTLVVNAASVPVSGISVTPATLALNVNATSTLTATVSPANATNKSVTWLSSAPAIASVSSTGVVTAKVAGTATITATTQDGGFTGTTTVEVTNVTQPPAATPITAPFVKDGAGDFYWEVAVPTAGKHFEFNSWNVSKVEINGVDFTGKWASTQAGASAPAPAPINGKYYIRYSGSFAWSHFEILVKP